MKSFSKPVDVMNLMHRYIADAYRDLPAKEKGIIQFCLYDCGEPINCFFAADGETMSFAEGISESWEVKLEASFSDWLKLANKKLNPVLGVFTRRLKFSGDTSYFKKLIPNDLYKVNLDPFTDRVTDFERKPQQEWKRPGKVLIIDSSPRNEKGYTKLYSDFIESSLREKEVEVNHILLSNYKIDRCLGCLQCWLRKEGECILKDDVAHIYEMYEEADLIIYAFPLYAYGVPGLLKDFIDRGVMRQYPYFEKGVSEIRHPRRAKADKGMVVFSICGFPSFSQFDSVRSFFRLYSHSSHMPLIAEIYRPGAIFLVQNPFNYEKMTRFLKTLRLAVHEIVDQGRIESKTKRRLKIGLDEKSFLQSTNKYWDNLYKAKEVNY